MLALDWRRGRIIWNREIGRGKLPSHQFHNMATPTPVSDGGQVWALFGTGDIACLDHNGEVIWQRNLVKEYGEFKTNHGYGSSPMLLAGRLFIACMHQGPSWLLALDPKTGMPSWQERLFTENVKVSPVAGDGKVYFTSGQANCIVIKAGGELQILATNLLNEVTLSTPAISSGRVFIRTQEHLFSVKD